MRLTAMVGSPLTSLSVVAPPSLSPSPWWSPDRHQTITQTDPRTGVQHGAQNGASGTPLRDPPPGAPPAPRKFPGRAPGGPRPGPPRGAPRGPPGGPPGAPQGTPKMGPFGALYTLFSIIEGGSWGGTPQGPSGAPRGVPPGGAKKCTFFWVFNNSPSRDKNLDFFRGPKSAPPAQGAPGWGVWRGYLGGSRMGQCL